MSKKIHIPASLLSSARGAALKVLFHVEHGQTAQSALAAVIGEKTGSAALPVQERNLCSELVYGVLRYEHRLNFILRPFLKQPEKTPLALLLILRLGVYSLLFQEKIPPHAAVYTAVSLTSAVCGKSLSRVTNGVLRSVQRLGNVLYNQNFYTTTDKIVEAGLSRYFSLPLWLVQLWRKAYGEKNADKLMQRSLSRPWSGLRFNPHHKESENLRKALCAYLDENHYASVTEYGLAVAPGKLPEFLCDRRLADWIAEGAVSFQSAGSQAVLQALGCTHWQKPVWDACAGYGGKSMALLEAGVRCALASDISLKRLHHLPDVCRRLGLDAPSIVLGNAAQPPLQTWSGHILADVPCSGHGVLSRRPDLRKRITPERTRQLQLLQRQILAKLTAVLAPGSQLAYITCALDPAENEKAIHNVLEGRHDLMLKTQWQTPHDHPWMEGMYGALLEKTVKA